MDKDTKPKRGGQQGNTNAARGKHGRAALLMELKANGETMPDLRKVWRSIIREASAGSVPHAQLLFERLDGKVPQAVEGPDGNALTIQLAGFDIKDLK